MGSHKRRKWRIYQFLSSMGAVHSKEQAVKLARSGKITVDGEVIESLHYQINPVKQVIAINGKRVELKENRRYFVLNKPKGVVCTKADIIGFFHLPVDLKNSLSPVGRLDKDTSGLLIVTNDGRLAQRVLDPKTKRAKFYEAVVKGDFTEADAQKLRLGVWIKTVIDDEEQDYLTLPAVVKVRSKGKDRSTVHIAIIEGKKRQVRLMLGAVGHKVISLRRIAIAKLKLGVLKPGEVKEYDKEAIYRLLFE